MNSLLKARSFSIFQHFIQTNIPYSRFLSGNPKYYQMNLQRLTVIFTLSLLSFLINSCSPNKPQDPKQEIAELKNKISEYNSRIAELEASLPKDSSEQASKFKSVIIDSLKNTNFKEFVDIQGMVDAEFNVMASPQMPGVVSSILVKVGDFVKKGRVLAHLDGSTIRQGMEELKTGLSLATTMYEKQKSLWDQKIGSEAQYLAAKNQKEQLEERLKTLQTQLALTSIKAPVDGIVDEVRLKIGEMASPGFTGIRVVNNNSLTVRAKVSDLYSNRIKKGDPVLLFFPDLNKEVQSFISYTSMTVNQSSRTITVEAKLPHGKLNYKANQLVKLKINNGLIKNTLTVPTNVIQTSIDGEDYVLIAESVDNQWKARKKVITLGPNYNGISVIKSGLKPGDLLITTGYSDIVDGQNIKF